MTTPQADGTRISARELAQDALTLVSLPDVYLRLREVMDSEQASMDDVARVLSLDPALVARLLKIANSALYGLPAAVETVSRAVNILGIEQVHELVLAANVARAFQGLSNEVMDLDTFWYRAVQCGFLARSLAEGAGLRHGEALFVRGLLHDIGHLVLYNRHPGACRAALAAAGDDLCALYREERRLLGCDANQVTAEIARAWGLPDSFVESYTYLHRPLESPARGREVALLQIAARITHGVDTDLLMEELIGGIEPGVWGLAELPPEAARLALEEASVEVVDAMYGVLASAA